MKAYEKQAMPRGEVTAGDMGRATGGSVVLGVYRSSEGAFGFNARDTQGEALRGQLLLVVWR